MKLKIRNIRCWYTKKHDFSEPEFKTVDTGVIKRERCKRLLCDMNRIDSMTFEQFLRSDGMPEYKIQQWLAKNLQGRIRENIRLDNGKILPYVNNEKQAKNRIWATAKKGFTKRAFTQYVINLKKQLRAEHKVSQKKQIAKDAKLIRQRLDEAKLAKAKIDLKEIDKQIKESNYVRWIISKIRKWAF